MQLSQPQAFQAGYFTILHDMWQVRAAAVLGGPVRRAVRRREVDLHHGLERERADPPRSRPGQSLKRTFTKI